MILEIITGRKQPRTGIGDLLALSPLFVALSSHADHNCIKLFYTSSWQEKHENELCIPKIGMSNKLSKLPEMPICVVWPQPTLCPSAVPESLSTFLEYWNIAHPCLTNLCRTRVLTFTQYKWWPKAPTSW